MTGRVRWPCVPSCGCADTLGSRAELLPVPGKDDEFDRVAQNVVDVEDSLEEALAAARKSLKCPDIEFKDIGTKDIKQVRNRGALSLSPLDGTDSGREQLEVPAGVKVPNNWTKISGTQKVNRYYTPETTRLISDLKEARERKQMVVNDFQFKASSSRMSRIVVDPH